MSEAFVNAYRIFVPLGTPYRISYLYEEKSHDYLPDFVGTFCDGGLLVAEAGRDSEKRQGQPLVKAEAARRLAQLKGEAIGLVPMRIFLNADIITCFTYTPNAKRFPRMTRLLQRF